MTSFRSLLQGFQAATGTTSNNNEGDFATSNAVLSRNDKTPTTKDVKSALFEWTSQIWNQTQIRQATLQAAAAAANNTRTIRDTTSVTTSISHSLPSSPSTTTSQDKTIHLAVCICIVDSLPHENIWRRWIQDGTSRVTASVYIHAKHPERIQKNGSSWLKQCLIPMSHQPNWNDVRVVRAMLSLIEHATSETSSQKQTQPQQPIADQIHANATTENPVTHILFATESCIPIAPIQDLLQVLLPKQNGSSPHKQQQQQQSSLSSSSSTAAPFCSFLDYYGKNEATRFEERTCWNVVGQYLPMDCIQKALPGWCLLTVQHAREVLQLSYPQHRSTPSQQQQQQQLRCPTNGGLQLPPPPKIPQLDLTVAFEECWAPEEVYFATALCLLGHIRPSSYNNNNNKNDDNNEDDSQCLVQRKSLVYAEWPPGRREDERAHPKVWDDEFSPHLIARLRPLPSNSSNQNHYHSNSSRQTCSSSSSSPSHILFLRKVKHRMPIEAWERAVFGTSSSPPPPAAVVGREATLRTTKTGNSRDSSYQRSRSRSDSGRHYRRLPKSPPSSPPLPSNRTYDIPQSHNKRKRTPDHERYYDSHREDRFRGRNSQRQRYDRDY